MKRLHAAKAALGLLAALACLITTPSGGDSEESELEKGTNAFLEVDDYENALKLVEGFILENPERPIGHATLAKVLAANGQTEKAFKAYYQFYKLSETLSGELLLELLLGALNDDSSEVRAYATYGLRELGDNRAVPVLINLLNDNNSEVVLYAAVALGKLGDQSAIPGLSEIIGDDNQEMYIKFEVVKALVKLSRDTHK